MARGSQGLTASVGDWNKIISGGRRKIRRGTFCVTHWRWGTVISGRAGDETVRLDLQERSKRRSSAVSLAVSMLRVAFGLQV